MDARANPVDPSLLIEAIKRVVSLHKSINRIGIVYHPVIEYDLAIDEWKRSVAHINEESYSIVWMTVRLLAQTGHISWAEAAEMLKGQE